MTDRKQLNNEQAILGRFQELRNEISQTSAKANELAAESQEHELVLKALEPMEGGRKCYRVVRQPVMYSHIALLIPLCSQLDALSSFYPPVAVRSLQICW